MPDRPLVLFPEPTVADKEKRHGGAPRFNKPTYERQISRVAPQFTVLKNVVDQGGVRMTNTANEIEPEYTLVFETIGEPSSFFTAIKTLKKNHPNIELVMELTSSCPNDEDYFVINQSGERDDNKQLSTKIFCILTNLAALSQILSLWNHYKDDRHYNFPYGLTGFRQLFDQLKSVHQWGIQERIEDTGLLDDWRHDLQVAGNDQVKAQIELFYRSSNEKQREAEQKVSELITSAGGSIICKSLIPEIHYHALLVNIPRAYAERILNREEVGLISAEEIMFMKSSGQSISITEQGTPEELENSPNPERIIEEPIIALFDGVPQENHPLLNGLLTVDDPDSIADSCPVDERIHGTSMASLILRGQNMNSINHTLNKVYVRPILKSNKDFHGKVQEYIPEDYLIVDKIHECVRRLFEANAGNVAPSIRIINLSIGISYREYYNSISPLARLLDWLSYKYRVLFVVSAGNHPEDINLGVAYSDFNLLDNSEKDKVTISYIAENARNLRLLSPAESLNSLTVGAIFNDTNNATPIDSMTNICSDGMIAPYSSFGRGINNSIKPDIIYNGGRSFIREKVSEHNTVKWVDSYTRKPGIESAYPSAEVNGNGTIGYSFGTSNSAALITNKAAECYTILNEVFITETGESLPRDYAAVLIKAMLAHGASWSDLSETVQNTLNFTGRQAKNELHRFLGYGITDIDKVKECTKNQITLIGYGEIHQDEAFEYAIPLPFSFHSQKLRRKVIITLAYFSPISPSINKYRDKQLWLTVNNGNNIAGSRSEYDYHAVQRGTLQHEIFETDSTAVWDDNDSMILKVNCRADASNTNNVPIPYALFTTFEIAPEHDINVYQSVVDKIRIRDAITTTVE